MTEESRERLDSCLGTSLTMSRAILDQELLWKRGTKPGSTALLGWSEGAPMRTRARPPVVTPWRITSADEPVPAGAYLRDEAIAPEAAVTRSAAT